MRVWRLARSVYPTLNGEGARRYGGRWNPPGIPVVYTAEYLSLAVLEQLVHLDPERLPDDYRAYEIEVPDGLAVQRVRAADLPDGWNRTAESRLLRRIGADWASEERAAILTVPSAVIPEERNVLINPAHRDAAEVHLTSERPFDFDPRLFS
jgi:RES domain-containing protein